MHPFNTNRLVVGLLLTGLFFTSSAYAIDQIKPGQWDMRVNMHMKNMPQIPPEQLAQMKQMGIELPFGDKPMQIQQCITPEQASLNKPFDASKGAQGCVINNYKHNGNSVTGDMLCSGEMKATGKFEMTLKSDSEYSGKWSLTGTSKEGVPIDQTTEMSGKWVKTKCDASAGTYGKE